MGIVQVFGGFIGTQQPFEILLIISGYAISPGGELQALQFRRLVFRARRTTGAKPSPAQYLPRPLRLSVSGRSLIPQTHPSYVNLWLLVI